MFGVCPTTVMMMKNRFWDIIIMTLVLYSQNTQAKRDFAIEILNFQVNTSDLELFKLPIQSTFTRNQLSVEFMLKQSISEWSALLGIDSLRSKELKLAVNMCDCLKGACRNNLVVTLLKEMLRTSNFPKSCPLKADKKYAITNYTVRPDDFPRFIPTINWQLTVDMMFNRKLAMIWSIEGRTAKL
ncbi:uncharacterized protein LOC142235817 [Haematobia irritans]|uniref:uncharacterized protein LOC142235817 n=1 Tax=Haematobia irritans TaxID=7368 RepID=UPI003F5057B6